VLPYVIGWCGMFGTACYWLATGRIPRASLYCILIYCCLLACLRGNTGTDTEMYQNIFTAVQLGNIDWTVEAGFALVAQLIMNVGLSPEAAVRGISVVFFALVAIYAARATLAEKWVLLAFILPVFAYQYSMNGLRIGLASALLLLCTQEIRRGRSSLSLLWLIGPVVIHLSTFVSGVYLAGTRLAQTGIGAGLLSLFAPVSLLVLWYASGSYLLDKQAVYEEMVSPNEVSGLGRVVVIIILTSGICASYLSKREKALIVVPAILLTGVAWLLARSSFAGLRFLDLISFVLPLAACIPLGSKPLVSERKFVVAVLVAGLVGATATARNFAAEAGHGDAPFVPYHFWVAKP
jgi:hypothetical protein